MGRATGDGNANKQSQEQDDQSVMKDIGLMLLCAFGLVLVLVVFQGTLAAHVGASMVETVTFFCIGLLVVGACCMASKRDGPQMMIEEDVLEDGHLMKKSEGFSGGSRRPPSATTPTIGDTVTVQLFVGTLAETGKEFPGRPTLPEPTLVDSSRARDTTFTFTLGRGEVIQGWDAGVASMFKGERAVLTIHPSLGYGESGAGDKIPPNATLEFNIELLSFEKQEPRLKLKPVTCPKGHLLAPLGFTRDSGYKCDACPTNFGQSQELQRFRCEECDYDLCQSCYYNKQALANDEGEIVNFGTRAGCKSLYYCGRHLGKSAIPGSDGQCGPNNGPQCASCTRLQSELRSAKDCFCQICGQDDELEYGEESIRYCFSAFIPALLTFGVTRYALGKGMPAAIAIAFCVFFLSGGIFVTHFVTMCRVLLCFEDEDRRRTIYVNMVRWVEDAHQKATDVGKVVRNLTFLALMLVFVCVVIFGGYHLRQLVVWLWPRIPAIVQQLQQLPQQQHFHNWPAWMQRPLKEVAAAGLGGPLAVFLAIQLFLLAVLLVALAVLLVALAIVLVALICILAAGGTEHLANAVDHDVAQGLREEYAELAQDEHGLQNEAQDVKHKVQNADHKALTIFSHFRTVLSLGLAIMLFAALPACIYLDRVAQMRAAFHVRCISASILKSDRQLGSDLGIYMVSNSPAPWEPLNERLCREHGERAADDLLSFAGAVNTAEGMEPWEVFGIFTQGLLVAWLMITLHIWSQKAKEWELAEKTQEAEVKKQLRKLRQMDRKIVKKYSFQEDMVGVLVGVLQVPCVASFHLFKAIAHLLAMALFVLRFVLRVLSRQDGESNRKQAMANLKLVSGNLVLVPTSSRFLIKRLLGLLHSMFKKDEDNPWLIVVVTSPNIAFLLAFALPLVGPCFRCFAQGRNFFPEHFLPVFVISTLLQIFATWALLTLIAATIYKTHRLQHELWKLHDETQVKEGERSGLEGGDSLRKWISRRKALVFRGDGIGVVSQLLGWALVMHLAVLAVGIAANALEGRGAFKVDMEGLTAAMGEDLGMHGSRKLQAQDTVLSKAQADSVTRYLQNIRFGRGVEAFQIFTLASVVAYGLFFAFSLLTVAQVNDAHANFAGTLAGAAETVATSSDQNQKDATSSDQNQKGATSSDQNQKTQTRATEDSMNYVNKIRTTADAVKQNRKNVQIHLCGFVITYSFLLTNVLLLLSMFGTALGPVLVRWTAAGCNAIAEHDWADSLDLFLNNSARPLLMQAHQELDALESGAWGGRATFLGAVDEVQDRLASTLERLDRLAAFAQNGTALAEEGPPRARPPNGEEDGVNSTLADFKAALLRRLARGEARLQDVDESSARLLEAGQGALASKLFASLDASQRRLFQGVEVGLRGLTSVLQDVEDEIDALRRGIERGRVDGGDVAARILAVESRCASARGNLSEAQSALARNITEGTGVLRRALNKNYRAVEMITRRSRRALRGLEVWTVQQLVRERVCKPLTSAVQDLSDKVQANDWSFLNLTDAAAGGEADGPNEVEQPVAVEARLLRGAHEM